MSPTEPFRAKRGVKQGDPISSFLFTLVDEALGILIEKAQI